MTKNTKGGAADETMKMAIVIQFVLKLTCTLVLTQIGTNTKITDTWYPSL